MVLGPIFTPAARVGATLGRRIGEGITGTGDQGGSSGDPTQPSTGGNGDSAQPDGGESSGGWAGGGPLGNPYVLLNPKEFFGRRFWAAAFVCTTYLLAFGKVDGKPMIEAAGEKMSGLTGIAGSRNPQPAKVGVRANVKSKAAKGHGARARTRRDGPTQEAARGDARRRARSAVGVSERRDSPEQTGGKEERRQLEQQTKLKRNQKGQFVKPEERA